MLFQNTIVNILYFSLFILQHYFPINIYFLHIFFVPLALVGVAVSVSLLIKVVRKERCSKLKNYSSYNAETAKKWIHTIRVIYWCGFVCILFALPMFLRVLIEKENREIFSPAILYSFLAGSIFMKITFSKLRKSFSKKYALCSIASLYVAYWPLLLWVGVFSWECFFDFINKYCKYCGLY